MMRILLAIAICGIAATPSPAAQAGAFSRHTLPNGLTVIISTNRSADLVSVQVVTDAGQRMMEPGQAGIAAFVTSMLVRGTQRRNAQEIAVAVESVGGTIGTSTAQDYSQLSTITPSRHLDLALDVLADMVTNAKFDPADIETQRRITLSVIRQRLDQPSIRVQEIAAGSIYPYHPYGLPLAGTIETVTALTRDDLVRFYQTFYIASNMVVVVAGNVTQDAALDKVRRAFGNIRTGILPQRARLLPSIEKALAPRPLRPVEIRETQRTASAWIAISYATPEIGHRDWTALRVLDTILGSGLSSRLFVEIRERRGLAYSVSSAYLTRAGPSMLLLIAATDAGNLQQVIDGMLREATKLAETPVSAEELERAKNRIIGTNALNHEDLRNQAFLLGWYEVLGVGFEFDRRIPDLISKVTAADVQRVARVYLKNPVIAIVSPPR
jgi:zinc protease